jgi:FKBP-type peptidyl-prolyl cis-trans isomerase
VGTKLDGTVIDETYSDGTPATFGMKEVLPAWREVLLKMEEGAEFELYVPPSQMTRGSVRNRGVTGFEPTLYLIELLTVVSAATDTGAATAN